VLDPQDQARFEQLVLPHLDAAFNLSRWLLRGRAMPRTSRRIHAARVSLLPLAFTAATPAPALADRAQRCYTWLEKNRSVT